MQTNEILAAIVAAQVYAECKDVDREFARYVAAKAYAEELAKAESEPAEWTTWPEAPWR